MESNQFKEIKQLMELAADPQFLQLRQEVADAETKAVHRREHMDTIKKRLLAETPVKDEDGDIITHPAMDWAIPDDDFQAYQKKYREAYLEWFPDTPEDQCPALIAEEEYRRKREQLLNLFCEKMEIPKPFNLELRQQLLEIINKI